MDIIRQSAWLVIKPIKKQQPTISAFKHNLETTVFPNYKYLTVSHLENDIYQYYMLE